MDIQMMREQAAAKIEAARELQAKQSLNPHEEKKFNALIREAEGIKAQIQRAMEIDGLTDPKDALTVAAMANGAGGVSRSAREGLQAMAQFYKVGDSTGFGVYNAAMTEGGSGGVVVPTELSNYIADLQKKYNPLRELCRVVSTQTAASKFVQPVNLGGLTSGWVGEADARTATDAPTLDEVEFPDGEVYCNLPVSQWWMEDSQLGSWIAEEIAKEFSKQENSAFISGSGTKKPKGFLIYDTAATADAVRDYGDLQHVASGSTSSIGGAEKLIDLCYSLRNWYRQNGVWLMNSATLAVVRKLKDSQNRFLWEPGLNGQPQTLLGYRVVEDDTMSDIAENALPIAFGDFKAGYTILDRTTTLLRDPFTSKPNVLFYARKRVSGALVDSNAIKVLKIAAA